jgi:hypothetical protein
MNVWPILFLFIATIGALWWLTQIQEGFAYKKNPCKEFTNCKTCAEAAACGWCSDLKVCQPMAQDGLPIRTLDSSTDEEVIDSPYLEEPRSEADIIKTAPASRIHICNPFGFVTNADVCENYES